jgi:hypothetical protein
MSQESFIEKQEENISIHIFTVSAAMVGVCLTVIGILNVISSSSRVETFGDEITAVDAVFFLFSCLISYLAIKTKERKHRYSLEKIADFSFLIGLFLMAIVCILIVYKSI